jgi:predicted amidohydrolase YtcJ
MYTQGSAWFAHDDHRRGALGIGKFADLAVLDRDYLTIPVQDIGSLQSLLTMVGGRVVYAAEPFAKLQPQ